MEWACGVTTVPARRTTTLPQTLASLAEAGFDRPHLFVDGCDQSYWRDAPTGQDVTIRRPRIGVYGNWVLSLAELYIGNPKVDRYAIFQDDLVACRGLRQFLDATKMPDRGYWNLFTYRQAAFAERGWHLSNQYGRGALALVFSGEAVVTLLTHQRMVDKPRTAADRTKVVDGAVALAMQAAGWKEWVHHPSLVNHTGDDSTLGNRSGRRADSFTGYTL